MSASNLSVLIPALGFCDGLRWRAGELWFSDFIQRRVFCYRRQTGELSEQAYVPGQPSGIGFMPDGSLLIASMHDRLILRLSNGQLTIHADLSRIASSPLNDLVVDETGRIYVGSYGYQAAYEPAENVKPSSLYLIDHDRTVHMVADGLMFPNGMAVADCSRLLVAETFGNRISAYDISSDGSLSNRRVFADLAGRSPDGLCIDVTGVTWVACPFTQEIVRIDVDGAVTTHVSLSDRWPTSVVADDECENLFVATARTTLEGFHSGISAGAIESFGLNEMACSREMPL